MLKRRKPSSVTHTDTGDINVRCLLPATHSLVLSNERDEQPGKDDQLELTYTLPDGVPVRRSSNGVEGRRGVGISSGPREVHPSAVRSVVCKGQELAMLPISGLGTCGIELYGHTTTGNPRTESTTRYFTNRYQFSRSYTCSRYAPEPESEPDEKLYTQRIGESVACT